jgi:hypothetical protein
MDAPNGRGSGRATPFELDHVFVCVPPGAPEASGLLEAGFAEGPANTHPGQGTACRRFFFDHAYLELLWLLDQEEARSPAVRNTGLSARADLERPASRLGICLRSPSGHPPPVETWPYRAPYLPADAFIPTAMSSTRPHEPLIFFLPPAFLGTPRPSVTHPNRARAVTDVALSLPRPTQVSPALEWLAQSGIVEVTLDSPEELRWTLDGGSQGGSLYIPGSTPIRIQW